MTTFNTDKFYGVYVAMPACYDKEGEVSPEAIANLVRYLKTTGIRGLYVGGSTGEGMLQTKEERKLVLETAVKESAGELQIIAHIGAITTRESVELAKHAEQLGVDAISSIPPFYYRPSDQGVKNHWLAMIEATKLPFIIYHIPGTTGFNLSTSLFKEMVAHNQVVGLKITTSSSYELQQFKRFGGDNFVVFNGPDEQYVAGRVMGACGGIGGTYGAMPELFVKIERCYTAGDIDEAARWQFRVNEIIADMLSVPIYAALKHIIALRGVDIGAPRLPIEPLGPQHMATVERIAATIDRYVSEI
ncbi:MAG: dihydrodipicolinate synthase family protein [Paenibacillaceae bacterium]|nr:dihydrodipicolinate synthase family protein [Paenibacillaceae bacterium]